MSCIFQLCWYVRTCRFSASAVLSLISLQLSASILALPLCIFSPFHNTFHFSVTVLRELLTASTHPLIHTYTMCMPNYIGVHAYTVITATSKIISICSRNSLSCLLDTYIYIYIYIYTRIFCA